MFRRPKEAFRQLRDFVSRYPDIFKGPIVQAFKRGHSKVPLPALNRLQEQLCDGGSRLPKRRSRPSNRVRGILGYGHVVLLSRLPRPFHAAFHMGVGERT